MYKSKCEYTDIKSLNTFNGQFFHISILFIALEKVIVIFFQKITNITVNPHSVDDDSQHVLISTLIVLMPR